MNQRSFLGVFICRTPLFLGPSPISVDPSFWKHVVPFSYKATLPDTGISSPSLEICVYTLSPCIYIYIYIYIFYICMCNIIHAYMSACVCICICTCLERDDEESWTYPTYTGRFVCNQDSYLPAVNARETRELWSIACPKFAASEPLGWKVGSGSDFEPAHPKRDRYIILPEKGPPHHLAVSTSAPLLALTGVSSSPQRRPGCRGKSANETPPLEAAQE